MIACNRILFYLFIFYFFFRHRADRVQKVDMLTICPHQSSVTNEFIPPSAVRHSLTQYFSPLMTSGALMLSTGPPIGRCQA